jgi:3-hydroxyisobutyrate dehydrogenase
MTPNSGQEKPRLGFIGLGHMGRPMVARLMNAGYKLTAYDRTKDKAQAFTQRGAIIADTPKDLASSCDIILSCVTNDSALDAVMLEQDGALNGVDEGRIILDMSTVSPNTSRHICEAAQQKGVSMLDAAVSGSVPQVEQGQLVIFVGGERNIYEQCRPILDVLGKQSFYIGPSGMGTSMKLVVNTLLGLGLQAVAEAIALGEKSGIEKNLLLDVLGQTTVISPNHKAKLDNVRREEYPDNFGLALMYKDFGLILEQAAQLSVPMPTTAAAQQTYAAAMVAEQGREEDYSVILRFMEQLAGVSVQH